MRPQSTETPAIQTPNVWLRYVPGW